MKRNLAAPTYGDVVERTLAFEPRETPLYGLSLGVQRLPLRGALRLTVVSQQLLVSGVYLNYGLGLILTLNQLNKRSTRVALIGNYKPRIAPCGEPSFTKQVAGPFGIMDVTRADVGGGVDVTPVGFIEVMPDETRYVSIEDRKRVIRAIVFGTLLGFILLWRRRRREESQYLEIVWLCCKSP